jgi:alkylation response protein AidB-like acyl-CoA dehydrogenase
MRLIPDQDERDLVSMLRGMLATECPPSLARAQHDPDAERSSPTLWKALADTGVLGLGLPAEHGGSGGTLADLGLFCVEAGRALCPTLAHSTVIAAFGINALGCVEDRERWLRPISSGELPATSALWHPGDAAIVTPVLRAEHRANGWCVSGAADFVADADLAEVIVVPATDRSTGRTLAFVIGLNDPAVSVQPLPLMGGYRAFRVAFGDVSVQDASAVLAGGAGLGADNLRRVANAAVALMSLDLVGVGEAVLERTVDYISMRRQFGRPIAAFQAAQHLVANMHIALAAARLAARSAVFWIGRGRTATREAAVARMQSATAAKLITLDAHQLHGGMGYVLETDLHLWSERARVLSTLGGGADVAARWLQAEMGLGE